MALGYGRVGTNQFACAKFIVDTNGLSSGATHTTIASAIASAVSGETIFIKPGTYTENLTLKAGVTLTAAVGNEINGAVKIVGKCSYSGNGRAIISNIQLQTNGDYCVSVTGATGSGLTLVNCYINCTDFTGIEFTSSDASALVDLYDCDGTLATTGIAIFTSSAVGRLLLYHCNFENGGGSTTSSTKSDGDLQFRYTRINSPVTASGTCFFGSNFSLFRTSSQNVTALTISSSQDSFLRNSDFRTGSATSLIVTGTALASICDFENTNAAAISGAGTLSYGNCQFNNTGDIITVTTQIPTVQANDAVQVTTPGAYPYTAKPQDYLIRADSSGGAVGITLNASPVTGQQFVIKDVTGSAGTSNITITPAAGTIDGAATYVLNQDYQSVSLIYDGSSWMVI